MAMYGGPEKKGHKRTSRGYKKPMSPIGEMEPVRWSTPPPSMVTGYPKQKKNPNSMMMNGGAVGFNPMNMKSTNFKKY